MTNRPRHYKPRAEKPSKKAVLAAMNAFRPLGAPEITAERKRPRRFKEDAVPSFEEAPLTERTRDLLDDEVF